MVSRLSRGLGTSGMRHYVVTKMGDLTYLGAAYGVIAGWIGGWLNLGPR